MDLLQKLKSALGLDASGSPAAGANTPNDVDVTVEREPSTESEDAVKGTETATPEEPNDDDSPPEPMIGEQSAEETGFVAEAEAEAEADEAAESETEATEAAESEAGAETASEPQIDSNAPVTEIKGVGPAYAERLENAGVSTVTDLAVADADELAEATDLSPNRVSGWIDQAESF